METFGIMGFIFGLAALGKIIMLEKQLKESGVPKEQTESDDKQIIKLATHQAPPSSEVFCLQIFRTGGAYIYSAGRFFMAYTVTVEPTDLQIFLEGTMKRLIIY